MKKKYLALISIVLLSSCDSKPTQNKVVDSNLESPSVVGTWKLVYAETKERDSIQVRSVTKTDFIKIINDTHFAFFSQDRKDASAFYGGGGTYSLNGNQYVENLEYSAWDDYRDKNFLFTVEIKGDSLFQYGFEEIKERNIKKYIIEKYIKIK